LILTILLGFVLRTHELDGQSLWSDEGLSYYRATLSLPEILANNITIDGIDTRDTNPPFYFLLLHVVRAAAGETVFALRFAGVVVGSLAIPLMYVLGSTSLGRRVGLMTAILMAISPFHVWQSQVLRNYSLLLTLNLLSVYGLFRYLLARPGNRHSGWLILWLAAGLLGIYTHFFGFFVFAFGLLALTISLVKWWGIRRLLGKVWFWMALGLALLVLLPGTILAINRFAAGRQVDFAQIPLSTLLVHAAGAFSVGIHWSLTHEPWRYLPIILIAFVGLYFAWQNRRQPTALLLGYQIIPLGLLYVLSYINPLYNGVRHLLIGLPPFLILLASGIVGPLQLKEGEQIGRGLRRTWYLVGPIMALVAIGLQLAWLNDQFTAPELVRDDVRGPATYLSENAGPADVVILHDTLIRPTFEYYYDGPAPVISVPRVDETDMQSAIHSLDSAADGADRVWFLTQPTPRTGFNRGALSDWANENWSRILDSRYAAMWLRVRLEGFLAGTTLSSVPDTATKIEVSWNQTLDLHGHEIPGELTAGANTWMTFYLSQPKTSPEQHTLSLRLVDEMGREWARMDETIASGFPPAASIANAMMRYDHQVSVPAGILSGRYALQARLVRTADGQTIPLSTGPVEYHLADVVVHGASCSAADDSLPSDVQRRINFGGEIQLLGSDTPSGEVRPGHPIAVDLWWCGRRQPEADYRLRLQLIDGSGQVVGESIGPLAREDYPTSHWQKDELLLGKPLLVVPSSAEAGLYDLELSVIQPDGDDALRIGWPLGKHRLSLGSIEVVPWPMETELPAISSPLQADFGQPPIIELTGYDLTDGELSLGETLALTLVWRSHAGNLPTSYKVFVHLVDDAGEIVSQSDSEPVGGFRPTTSWREGEVLSDSHSLSIPAEIGAGEYTLWAGIYDPETGFRLLIHVDGQEQPDGRLRLTTLTRQP
jgi:hypothetical protein